MAGDLLTRLLEPDNLADPHPLYAELREKDPAHRLPSGEWVFTRYEDVSTILRDPRFGRLRVPRLPLGSVGVVLRMFLLLDPPEHTRQRRAVARVFTPAAIADLRSLVVAAVEDLLAQRRQLDVVADLAHPLPLRVIAELLAVPPSHRPRLAEWSRVLVDALDPPLPARVRALPRALIHRRRQLPSTLRAVRGIVSYAREALRQDHPENPLLGALASAQEDGSMSEDEAVATWVMLLIAGHETSTHLIGNALLCLLRHPDQLARLRSDPSLVGSAVEECLRYEGPIVRAGRVAHDDLKVGETLVRRGELVNAFLGAANRDGRVFAEADRFDIGRPPTPAHLAFGSGIHFCLGAALARLETEVALSALLARGPSLATTHLEWRPSVALRGLVSLPVCMGNPSLIPPRP